MFSGTCVLLGTVMALCINAPVLNTALFNILYVIFLFVDGILLFSVLSLSNSPVVFVYQASSPIDYWPPKTDTSYSLPISLLECLILFAILLKRK